ncbi:hypothetical protein FSY75_14735 [Streptomyces sp. TR1341]|nr:hypothetical protein [Streptomyces sp. TR1341]
MTGRPVEPSPRRGTWSYPQITLHHSAMSLLDELVPYHVQQSRSENEAPVIKSGALLCGGKNGKAPLTELSDTIGVDLTNTDLCYALVKLTRVDDTDTHASAVHGILVHSRPRKPDPEYGISRNFTSAVARMPHVGLHSQLEDVRRLTAERATRALDSFEEFGTHYVSAVTLGDVILQVFAYSADKFQRIEKAYANPENRLAGPGAEDFAQFTTAKKSDSDSYGFVAQYGRLLNLSNSSVFNTAVEGGQWLDRLWSRRNSVFTPFNADSDLFLGKLQESYTDQVVTDVQLACLSVMIEQKRSSVWQQVLKGALVQKYRDTLTPNFAVQDQRDFSAMLPDDQKGLVSHIATPRVDVYKTRIDLQDMQFVAAREVRDLTVFANVLSVGADQVGAELPGQRVRLFAQIMDMRTRQDSSNRGYSLITVDDSAFDTLQIACDEFLGALALQSRSKDSFNVIVGGLKFALKDGYPVITGDVRTVPPPEALPDLTDSLQYSMVFSEAVMSDQTSRETDDVRNLVRNYLKWLARIIPANHPDPALVALRVRATALASYATNPHHGSFVPILPSSDYQEYVDRILSYLDRIRQQLAQNEQRLTARRQQELTIDVAKRLNENIIASGTLINNIIDATAAQQSDLNGYYDSLIAQQQTEAAQQHQKLDTLRAALHTAQSDMDFAVQRYRSQVEQRNLTEAVKLSLDIATNVFSLGTMIAIPATAIGAVKELGETAQKIQKTLNVCGALSKLYTGASAGLKGLQSAESALDGLEGAQFGCPANLGWDLMTIQFNEIIANGPNVEAKAALQSAFSTLILRGKAVTTAESVLHQVQRDIYNSRQQKELNDRQADRWKALQGKLRPERIEDLDRDAIDLMGMSGYLESLQNQMLVILAKAFAQQDLALQYAWLQPPTPVTSFSLLKFSSALVQQQERTIKAKSRLAAHQAAVTDPIDFVVEGIHPDQMTGGNSYTTTIFLDAVEFLSYVDARVVSVIASVDGVESAGGDTYHLRLAFNGTPFHDRNIERDSLTFRTPSRERVYVYRTDGSPAFSDKGTSWSDGVSQVTPFGSWEISFPPGQANKGLTFTKETLTLRLSFVLRARIVDPAEMMRLRAEQRSEQLLHLAGAPARDIPDLLRDDRNLALLSAPAQQIPDTSALMAQMYSQGSCTNNWDVVFNLALEQIDAALKAQYKEFKDDRTFDNVIETETRAEVVTGVTSIKKFRLKCGYPHLEFNNKNNEGTVQLKFELLAGSWVQKCYQVEGGNVKCDPSLEIGGETLTASVPLTKVQGQVEGHHTLDVVLDLSKGAFDVGDINLSDDEKVAFNKEVKAYFANQKVRFVINRLDLTNIPVLSSLKPSGFHFKLLHTQANQAILQMYIMTGGRELLDYSQASLNNIPEPLPLGQKASLMVRSQLVFEEILPNSLQKNGWILTGKNPEGTHPAWSSTVSDGSVTGTIHLSGLGHSEAGEGWMTQFTYFVRGGNSITIPVSGTTLSAQADGRLVCQGDSTQSLEVVQRGCTQDLFGRRCQEDSSFTEFNLKLEARLGLSIGGQGREQSIGIKTTSKSVNVTGHLAGGGLFGSDNLNAVVNKQVRDQLPGQIADQLSLEFRAISVFALKNLLFPSNNYIVFKEAGIPGDLLVVGDFANG